MSKNKEAMDNKNKKVTKGHYVGKFIKTVCIIVGIFLLASAVVCFGFYAITGGPSGIANSSDPNLSTGSSDSGFLSNMFGVPRKTNVLFLGRDETYGHTDVVLAACFDNVNNTIDVISVPRDTYVTVPDDVYQNMVDYGIDPGTKTMKLGEVFHYSNQDDIPSAAANVEEVVGDLLGVNFQYWGVIDPQAFDDIVDAMGGVYCYVPCDMDFDDPTQDLHIHLKEGWQTLDGHDAEGLIRYRHTYPQGDIQRISVEQSFMQSFFDQLLNQTNIVKMLPTYAKVITQDVDTNASISDIMKYAPYIPKLSDSSIHFYTLPGEPQTINGISYFICDDDATKQLSDEIFVSTDSTSNLPQNQSVDISSDKIEVLNGGTADGKANDVANALTNAGYDVENVDNYTGVQSAENVIYVNDDQTNSACSDQLTKYLQSNTSVITDPTMTDGYDICIIIGTSE